MDTKDEQNRQELPSRHPHYLPHFTTVSVSDSRRIVQICASKHGVYALASDGTIWLGSPVSETWHQLPNLPQE